MKNLRKKNFRVLLLVSICMTVLTCLGTTYAFFVYRGNGSNVSVEAGDINVEFTNDNNYLTTGNSYPISDDTGKVLPYYSDFSINATTNNMGIKYEIQVVPDANNSIDPQYIKLYLTDQNDNKITSVLTYNNLKKAEYNTDAKLVYTSYITETGIKDFRLRMWIDESYNLQEGQTFGFKIYLYAVNEKKPNYLVDTVVDSLGTNGVVAVATDGTLYTDSSNQTIREYRYSGSARYCTYTSGENTYRLNVEGETCPSACVAMHNIINNDSELFDLSGVGCTDFGGVLIAPNQTEPLDGEVKNYVMFNDELWRIIGVFEEETADGIKKELVKIIKDTPISNTEYTELNYTYNGATYPLKTEVPEGIVNGYYFWNDADFGQIYTNDWTKAGAQYYLNDETVGATSYYNSLDTDAKEKIEEVKYYLGNISESNSAAGVYNEEHCDTTSSCVWEGNQETWIGKIGLMYPSDFGYAANNSNWDLTLNDYYLLTSGTASQDNWMNDNIRYVEWAISPSAFSSNSALCVDYVGYVDHYNVDSVSVLSPVLYLKSNTIVSGGDGSYNTPYELE